jgi:hypothetical protein
LTRRTTLAAVVVAGLTLAGVAGGEALSGARPVRAADHLDSPAVSADRRVDLSDLYVFRARDSRYSVLAMNVNALTTPADTGTLRFAPDALYQFHLDTGSDAVEEFAFQVTFGPPRADGRQPMTVRWASGAKARAHQLGVSIGYGRTSVGQTATVVSLVGGGRAFAGPRDDPFFFDLVGATNGFQFTGADTFAGTNVSSIVLEVPNAWLHGSVGVWASTARPATDGAIAQVDRIGRPAMNNTFNHTDAEKDQYNQGVPSGDVATWTDNVVATVTFFGQSLEYAHQVAAQLLPDVLAYDPDRPTGYPNGRAPADDVIDATLALVTNSAVTTDLVDHNDVAFAPSFPYLAPAH